VRMAGVRIGEVKSTRLGARRAEALLSIDPAVTIKSDATAAIVMAGLIGTNYISIDLGSASAPDLVPPEKARTPRSFWQRLPFMHPKSEPIAEIRTKSSPDLNAVMAQVGELGKKLEGALGNLSGALTGDAQNPGIIQKIDLMVTENRDNIRKTTGNLQSITDKVNRGEGTLGRIINDPKLHDELVATIGEIKNSANEAKTFIANAQSIIDQVKTGQGAIGALVFDQKAGDDIKASIANLRSVSDKLSRGEGTLGKLDDSGPITAVGVVARGLF
jgi:phospholipid/cholesterol/gamma-HCH transport system substrate-binding protein